jgi:hypothetical protein
MSSETGAETPTERGASKVAFVLIVVFVLYCASLGPVIFLTVKMGWTPDSWPMTILGYIYWPHTMLAQAAPWYNDYAFWWFELAGGYGP